MITKTLPLRQTPHWQREWAQAAIDPRELFAQLQLDPALLPAAYAAARDFPLRVPASFIARMRPGDINDPLLRQVLPLDAETLAVPGFDVDPVGDHAARVAPGVLHKYAGRALLTVTGACAVHCRYCFRRHFPYADNNAAATQWAPALAHIAADTSITEVILSGGDPLSLADRRLSELVTAVAAIAHVRRLRIHTRVPIVLPSRVEPALIAALSGHRLPVAMVVHVNHAQEIDAAVIAALAQLADAGMVLLNQSVLLRGVNDNATALIDLSEALFAARVLPYYLHILDKVAGAAHFDIPLAGAQALHHELQMRLPGYLVPRLVQEIAGAGAKVPRALQP